MMAMMITKTLVAIALAVLIARPSFAQQNFSNPAWRGPTD